MLKHFLEAMSSLTTTTRRPPYRPRTTRRTPPPIITQKPDDEAKPTGTGTSGWTVFGPILLIALLIVGGALLYIFVLRERIPGWMATYRQQAASRTMGKSDVIA